MNSIRVSLYVQVAERMVNAILCELRWLPVRKRVHYKLLLLTYKTFNGSAPEYLVNQLQDYCPTRALRSGDQNLLSVKKTHMKIGDSSFTVAASLLWNALPCQIKKARTIDCFKSMIKPISLGYKLVIMNYVLHIILHYIYKYVEHAVLAGYCAI